MKTAFLVTITYEVGDFESDTETTNVGLFKTLRKAVLEAHRALALEAKRKPSTLPFQNAIFRRPQSMFEESSRWYKGRSSPFYVSITELELQS